MEQTIFLWLKTFDGKDCDTTYEIAASAQRWTRNYNVPGCLSHRIEVILNKVLKDLRRQILHAPEQCTRLRIEKINFRLINCSHALRSATSTVWRSHVNVNKTGYTFWNEKLGKHQAAKVLIENVEKQTNSARQDWVKAINPLIITLIKFNILYKWLRNRGPRFVALKNAFAEDNCAANMNGRWVIKCEREIHVLKMVRWHLRRLLSQFASIIYLAIQTQWHLCLS